MAKTESALYHCAQIRAIEQAASYYAGDAFELMARAGAEALFFIRKKYPKLSHIAVFCGAGNNAGDGYVFARLAHEQGLNVVIYSCKPIEKLPIAANNAAQMALEAGVACLVLDEFFDTDAELIVDALLGIGLTGPVHGAIASAINQINACDLPVVSLDLPSGLNADTGQVINHCVKASYTLTFIAPKLGLYTGDGPDYCGAIYCSALQLHSLLAGLNPDAYLLDDSLLPLPARLKNAHKGMYGHVLVIGGGPGMPGSVGLAAKAALRSGAGAVTIATFPMHVAGLLPLIPEAMICGVSHREELIPLLAKATICVLGPGLGESEWAQALFLTAIAAQVPMVIDASALRLLAQYPQKDDNWILTPHPGEAAALLACSSQAVQADRGQAAKDIHQHYGGVVVLKGAGTIIQTFESSLFVCPKGNPGMATAGMGDVLSGIIAGLYGQGLTLVEAAKLGVWVHAIAGDKMALVHGERGLLASDLLDNLPPILNCVL